MADDVSEDVPQDAPTKPYVHAEFAGDLSANVLLTLDKVSPVMLWGLSRMLDQYASDLWTQNQLQGMMAQEDAVPTTSPLSIARVMPADHLRKGGRN